MPRSQKSSNLGTTEKVVARKPLNGAEILELERVLMGVFEVVATYRHNNPVAKHIKFPPMPSILSESIAIAATPLLFGPNWTGRYGGSLCDVVIEDRDSLLTRRVEVKATGKHAFQELKEKDLRADTLIWIRFGQRFEHGRGTIEVIVLDGPGEYVKNRCRLDVRRFEALLGIRENQKIFRFESIAQNLSEAEVIKNPEH